MPKARKPDNILELTGTKRRNKARYKDRGRAATDKRSIGHCPSFLNDSQKTAWRELIQNDVGVLQRSDRIAVEMTARLMVQIRAGDTQAASQAGAIGFDAAEAGPDPDRPESCIDPSTERTLHL